MKKFVAFILTLSSLFIMSFSLTACGDNRPIIGIIQFGSIVELGQSGSYLRISLREGKGSIGLGVGEGFFKSKHHNFDGILNSLCQLDTIRRQGKRTVGRQINGEREPIP